MADFTRLAIMESFVDLLDEKPFNKITVKDIVNHCHINRNTFYYHFQDIYDLLHQTFEYHIEKSHIMSINRENWSELLDEILIRIGEQKRILMHIFNYIDTRNLCKYVRGVYWDSLEQYLTPVFDSMNVKKEDRDFFLTLLSDSMLGFGLEWAEKGFDETFARKNIDRVAYWLDYILSLNPMDQC